MITARHRMYTHIKCQSNKFENWSKQAIFRKHIKENWRFTNSPHFQKWRKIIFIYLLRKLIFMFAILTLFIFIVLPDSMKILSSTVLGQAYVTKGVWPWPVLLLWEFLRHWPYNLNLHAVFTVIGLWSSWTALHQIFQPVSCVTHLTFPALFVGHSVFFHWLTI